MEAFSLLKYWRVGTNGVNKTTEKQQHQQQQPITTTIATTVTEMNVEDEGEECVVDGDADDEGPFFDLEFAVPDDDEEEDDNHGGDDDDDDDDDGDSVTTDEEDEDGFDFTVSPGSLSSGGNQIDSSSSPNNLAFSPCDDIFFKGDGGKSVSPLFQSSSSSTSTTSSSSSVENSNSNPKVQFPVSLIKTATKLRVFMLGFKSNNSSNPKPKSDDQKPEQKPSTIRTELKQSKKFVTVKFRVDELLPMISLFTRDSSSSSAANSNNKITASSQEEIEVEDEEGKKLISKDVVQKYLKMIKPLYVRVSKRYNNNGGAFSPSRSMDNSSPTTSSPLTVKVEDEIPWKRKQGVSNLPNGLRIVRKHLGKSRSASSVNPVTTNSSSSSGGIQAKRRDDSLLQQQDGIQSAIQHCKRSFNASRDTDSCPRSSTESHEISIDSTRTSIDEVAAAGK